LNEDDVRRISHEVARREIRDVLTSLGVNPDNPFEFQARMQFLTTVQAVLKTVVSQTITAVVGLIAVGICWAVFLQATGAQP
jgi:2-iminoacetate synthase ThiH